MDETRTGGCLCGAVRFTARLTRSTFGACHCEMCRRWTGSALLGISLPEGNVDWQGADRIATRQSSDWAMRGWCRDCGSGLFYKVTMDSAWKGEIELPVGLFDDPNGLRMASEIWVDRQPDSYAYAGEGRKRLTRAECIAKFPVLGGGEVQS